MTSWRKFVKAVWRWIAKRMSWAFPALPSPVFDIHHRVPYAISISLSTSRLKQIGEKNLLKPLRDTAQAISNELGFTVRD